MILVMEKKVGRKVMKKSKVKKKILGMTAAYPKMQFPFFSRYHLHVNSSDLC